MTRTLLWSLCFGVAITATAAAAGLNGITEPKNPALRLAVAGQTDPMLAPAAPESGFGASASFRDPGLRFLPGLRDNPFPYDTVTNAFDTTDAAAESRTVHVEYALTAPASATGLDLDVAVAPRAGFSIGPEGGQVNSVGGEVRFGRGLANIVRPFDNRGATWDRPSWYFFAASDGSALTWTPEALGAGARHGLQLQEDRIVVGRAQVGVSMEANGMQASFGFTNRQITNGKETVDENFVGASFTMRH